MANRLPIKTPDEIERQRACGRELAKITEALIALARPGVSTGELGQKAEEMMLAIGAEPVFKGYGASWAATPFPSVVCLSINEEVVHGIPRPDRILKEGNLLKIDIGMRYQGMVTDMARMVAIGELSHEAWKLKETTEVALQAGIAVLKEGARMNDYARAVESEVKGKGYSCVTSLVGHGVGHELHEEPQVANYLNSGLPNFEFVAGMVVALEPMVNVGTHDVLLLSDGWTYITADKKLSAHCENTVLITKTGSEILTQTA